MSDKFQNDINHLVEEFNFIGQKKFKLIVLFGLLGDFDSFEYAINLKNFIDNHKEKNLDIFAIAIGNQNGKNKFCKFTGFLEESLIVVSDNQIHNNLKVSRGLDIGLGGWINMLLMLSGINSFKTIKEVIRGYTGDKKAKQIYSEFDKIDILKFLKFSGNSFKKVFGEGYLRPFELATFRLNNMNEIIQNWSDYILDEEYLPQRGASFLLNDQNQVVYKFFSSDVLGYSSNMRDPVGFLSDLIKE
ncbi:AhpC/TSA family protein [uncultured Prochlorococcus sp.]|uniref:AhpC/TSA family protein n=1 Tax=uncultured Prochlorococcus sp. TaxID=159733 RepID=UPI00258F85D2|nr:AhpC/TSA family protein [uncultured Prochlorococcus sp.]